MESIDLPEYEALPMDAVAPGVHGLHIMLVNVFALDDQEGGWSLIDAGLPFSADRIRHWAESHYGPGARPRSIVLTHGHFDHTGVLKELAEGWDVPIYAHPRELPYITGTERYPPPDPTVGGGIYSLMAPLFPRGPIDVGSRAHALPSDGSLPNLPDWRWIATPGHSPGHVSFFREVDGVLLAGDAFCTTKQESFIAVARQTPELHGPPAYYTPDWKAAQDSVSALAHVGAKILAPSHGRPMRGAESLAALQELAANFVKVAVPDHGKYVR